MRFRLVTGAFAVMLVTTGAVATSPFDLVGDDLLKGINEREYHTTEYRCFWEVEAHKTSVSPQFLDSMSSTDRAVYRASHHALLDRAIAHGEAINCLLGTETHSTPIFPQLLDRRDSLDSDSSDGFIDDGVVVLTVVATASDLEGPTPYEKATSTKQTTTQHTSSGSSNMVTTFQPVVATPEAAVPKPDGPTCDADGNCVFPPDCTVRFGEYIMCESEAGNTTPIQTGSASTSGSPTSVDATILSLSQSLAHKSGKESSSSMKSRPLSTASLTQTKSRSSTSATTRSPGHSSSSTPSTTTRAVDNGKVATSTVYITQAITVTVIAQPIISVYGTSNANIHNTVQGSKSSSIAVPTSKSAAEISKDIQLAVRENVDAVLSKMDGAQSADNVIDAEHALRVAARQDVSLLVAAIEAVAAMENTTDIVGERDALDQDVSSVVEVWSTVTASPSIVYVNEATATSAYNVTGVVYETQTPAVSEVEPVTTVAVVVTKSVTASGSSGNQSTTIPTKQMISTTSTITRNITLTDPINPHITTVVPLVPLGSSRAHFNNTSIDTDVYLNISTFSATGLTLASSHLTTISEALTITSATSVIVPPSMTTSTQSGDGNGMVGYTPAVTTDVGKAQSSAATVVIEASGLCLAMLAATALAAVFGMFMLL